MVPAIATYRRPGKHARSTDVRHGTRGVGNVKYEQTAHDKERLEYPEESSEARRVSLFPAPIITPALSLRLLPCLTSAIPLEQ